ncbi:isopeptide-forming domain-containing fimbrial protein [Streptococcus respiraculi]|uniref:isopeptide-forming domain-containing fimbrial protein n=1 Tax=Streptococcus respiraculi TaxID=2021971 RepID=UPI000E766427|nr:isopeptide-forming domain-containing fimbrial protein [Streptococcus respiraculi]
MKNVIKKVLILLLGLSLLIPMGFFRFASVSAQNTSSSLKVEKIDNATITSDGCQRKIEKTEKVKWSLPRQPIDLVILQDTSGSFKDTIGEVQKALKELTTPVTLDKYDPKNPRLIFTNDKDTTDRVMVNTFQGIDTEYQYDDWDGNSFVESNFKNFYREVPNTDPKYIYQLRKSELLNDPSKINQAIDAFVTSGGTPTVPAIEDTIAEYNKIKGDMKNNRKTVFLLVTDGVANGVRKDGKVVFDRSLYRSYALQSYFKAQGVEESNMYIPEAGQNYLARAKELVEAGNTLKTLVAGQANNPKDDGAVVVGFWENVPSFTKGGGYGTTYLNGFADTGVNTGDNRTVQEVFHEALQKVATNDTYYVNEQKSATAFAGKILKAVGQALVKENVEGEFQVTDGYTVDAVRINGKTVVEDVKDPDKQIQGLVKQEGNKVTISVPDSVFNPGDNKFDYDLSRSTKADVVDEEDEVDPPADYQPKKEMVEVPQLTGKFKVGEYETAELGSKTPQKVEVQELAYCYPTVTKAIKDDNPKNDLGTIEDPLKLSKKPSYSALLDAASENFTYTVNYSYNNVPYEFKDNVMLVDPLDYRLEVVNAVASDLTGQKYETRIVEKTDADGHKQTVVVADVPAKEKSYEHLLLKKATMTITVRLKEEYQNKKNKDYLKLLQDSQGFGLVNQASILWNGSKDPDEKDHLKATPDGRDTVRRSNAVYVKPPVETEITKVVNNKEHEDLGTPGEEFTYTVKSPWPGIAESFELKDKVVDELEIVPDSASVTIAGKAYEKQGLVAKVEGQTVSVKLDNKSINTITRLVTRKSSELPEVTLTFKAKIKDNADISKYNENGVIKVPNTANVILNGHNPITSNKVTVTPPKPTEPSVSKRINDTLTEFTTFDTVPYTYTVTTSIPNDMEQYKKFVIKDTLDSKLEFNGTPTIKGDAADLFDVATNGQTVTATVKAGKFAEVAKLSLVELEIPAKIKSGVSGTTIENKAHLDVTNKQGVEKEYESNPATVTPPPVTKRINEKETHLDIANETDYNYNIKTVLPTDITSYKKFVISDTLNGELKVVNTDNKKPFIKGDAAKFFDVKVEGQTITATMKDFKDAAALAAKEVELVIPSQIKAGVVTAKIPNTAMIQFTNKVDASGEKETPPVTVTPPTDPTLDKKIEDKWTEATVGIQEAYTYSITSKLPNDIEQYKSYAITDTLDSRLEFTSTAPSIEGDAAKFFDVKVEGQTVTATMKDMAKAGKLGNQSVKLVIPAKIKSGTAIEGIPNTARLSYINKQDQAGEKESQPVTVTPPPIGKKVNDKNHADLGSLSEQFTYTIDTKVPSLANQFEITDTLVKELNFAGDVVVKVGGKEIKDAMVQKDGQTLTVSFNKDQVEAYANQAVQVIFGAKIANGVSVEELVKRYPNEPKDKALVPNTASYLINHDPKTKQDTEPVTITPPSPNSPDIVKKVNGENAATLAKRDETFTYTIETSMPLNATAFTVTDQLEEVLEFVGENGDVRVTLDGKETDATISVKGQNLQVDFPEKTVKENSGKPIVVTFKAKIKQGANLSAYVVEGKTSIPNTAKYTIDHNPNTSESSNEVPVTPPTPEQPTIKKDVNGEDSATLATRDEVFTYHVKTSVPLDATEFSVKDTLVDVLEFVGETAQVTLNGQALETSQISIDGQTITAKLTTEQVKASGGQEVVLSFQAKIKNGANLSDYTTEQGTSVPNTASYIAQFPHQPEVVKNSNEVPVTPPAPEQPTIKKDVNGEASATLASRDEVFTYHVKTSVPLDATEFSVKDTLVDVLEFAGESAQVTLNGQALDASQITVAGQTITAKLTADQVKASGGQEVVLSFQAKIKDGANLSDYTTEKGTSVPNTASYIAQFPHQPEVVKNSNEVPVTPPAPEDPAIEKDVNGELSATLASRDEVFTYHVKTSVPLDATEFSVKDTLVDVLEFAGESAQASLTLNGQALDVSQISINGQTITAKLTTEQVKASGGQEVVLSFQAKIKDGANLSDYTTEQGTSVPNTASYIANFPHQPEVVKNSNEVPVTPPAPEEPTIKKDVNGEASATLASRDEVFTYHVKTSVPLDATEFSVKDTLVDVLEVVGDSAQVTLNGQALDVSQISINGQTITAKLTTEQVKASGGQEVVLSFQAKIKDGANLTDYTTEEKTSVPNTASYTAHFPHRPKVVKDSNEVPVIPPTPTEPEIDKKINETLEHLDIDREQTYMYNVTAAIPSDIKFYKEFIVSDELDAALELVGTPVAYVDGYDASDVLDVHTEGNKVTVSVKDFKRLEGFKKIQVYILSKIKADADLTSYAEMKVPNIAHLDFVNSNGIDGKKQTKPVTVTPPPSSETPPPPTPGDPYKTVSRVEGAEQTSRLALGQATDLFRFDIVTTVPEDKADQKTELTSLMITDTLDSLLKVDAVALKIDQPKFTQIKQSVQEQLDEVNKKLDQLNGQANNVGTVDAAREAKEKVQDLTKQLEVAKANLDKWLEAKAAQTANADKKEQATDASETKDEKVEDAVSEPSTAKAVEDKADAESEDKEPEEKPTSPAASQPAEEPISKPKQEEDTEEAKLKAEIASLEEALKAAQAELEKVEAEGDNRTVTSAADKVNLQKEAEKLTAKLAKIDKAIALLTNVNEKGELDKERLSKIAKVTVDGQYVEVDIENVDILEVLRGSNVRLIIYSSIKDPSSLSDLVYANGIDNTADVIFNHDPKTKKRTNVVKVVPPKPSTPTPKQPLPKGSMPSTSTPSNPVPSAPSSQKILPRTNSTDTHRLEIILLAVVDLFIVVLLLRKKKYN